MINSASCLRAKADECHRAGEFDSALRYRYRVEEAENRAKEVLSEALKKLKTRSKRKERRI
jgi:hypothetical protein